MEQIHLNNSNIICGFLVAALKELDPSAEQDIYERWEKNIDSYSRERRKFRNIINSRAFWLGVTSVLTFTFMKTESEQQRENQDIEKIVMEAKHAAIASYLQKHPDIASKIILPERTKDIFKALIEKTRIPELHPYLGL